jgi:hypothetical protein
MNGKYNRKESWEKQSVYDLDNGWSATLEYSHYGEMVARLDSPDRKTYWHCSNGIKDLPEFAREWLNGGDWWAIQDLVRPKFTKIY